MRRPNIVLIVSDQHNPHVAGYAGNRFVRTPNLDRISAEGVVFKSAYCSSPVCGPSRMSYMTGKYVHQIENWWNAVPLDPAEPTWAGELDRNGIETTLLGKIDAPGEYENPGFTHYRLSMRRKAFDPYPRREPQAKMLAGATRPSSRRHIEHAGSFKPDDIGEIGAGYDPRHGLYFQDRQVSDWAGEFLEEKAGSESGRPWVLHVGFEYPHWPYVCPERFFNMYYPDRAEIPGNCRFSEDLHPALKEWERWNDLGELPRDDLVRALAAYYGMVTALDEMTGEIITRLKAQGEYDNTYIIYTSDHGDSAGEHGFFFKHCCLEGSAGVPLIMRGPGIEPGTTVGTPVSLVDLYPTIMDCFGLESDGGLPGQSLFRTMEGGGKRDSVFSEWHGPGFKGAWYMLCRGDFKYTWYESFPPSLYNLAEDPGENRDLAQDPEFADLVRDFEKELRSLVNPEAISLKAKRDLGVITADGRDLSRE
ncbi:MAG: sulfatase-like hydrolase/transferase [Kiritimatiellia bacterium]